MTREDGDGENAGDDGAQPCVGGAEHAWALKGLHLSLTRGAEMEEQCTLPGCEALRYVSQPGGRKSHRSTR